MSVIDRFVVELALDPKKFSGPAKKAVEDLRTFEKQAGNTGNSIEGVGRKGADAFAGVRREALAMFAVFTAGRSLKAFASDATQANAQLSIMSRQLNMDPQALSRMESAAKAAGGSFGEMGQAYAALQKAMTNPEQKGKIALAFNKLGIKDGIIDPKTGQIRTDLIDQINKAISSGKVSKPKAASILDEIGVFGQGARNLAFMDRAQFNDVWGRANRLPAPTAEELKNSEKLYQHLSELRDEAQNLSKAFIGDLSPAIDGVVTKLMDWGEKNPEIAKKIAIVSGAVGELTGSLNGLVAVLASVAGMSIVKNFLGGDKKKFAELLAEIKSMKETQAKGGPTAASKGMPIGETAPLGSTYLDQGKLGRILPEAPKGATPWGLAAWLTYEFMRPQATNEGESDILKQMRSEGRTGPNSLGLPSKSPFFGVVASAVAQRESGGDYSKIGGYHNAYAGKYQMGDGAIKDAAHWLREPAPSRSQFLSDPAMQERFFRAYTDSNNAILSSSSDTYGKLNQFQRLAALGYAHNQGAGGAAAWLKTGTPKQDGFGTDATLYARDILKGLNQAAQARSDAANTGNTTTVHTGDIVIHTPATDAKGIARDASHEFRQQLAALNLGGLQ